MFYTTNMEKYENNSLERPEEPMPDLDYAGFKREDILKKEEYLDKIYDKYFPRKEGQRGNASRYVTGYHFFRGFAEKDPVIHKEMKGAWRLLQHREYFPTRADYLQEFENKKELLALEYKIHLMPKSEYTPFVFGKILEMLRDDLEFRAIISNFKVANDDKKERAQTMPVIVIYPAYGKEAAQLALDKIYKVLSAYADLGTGAVPRYNRKITDLIFYAQSGGDYKNDYLEASVKDGADWKEEGIFERSLVHFIGDYHLRDPRE